MTASLKLLFDKVNSKRSNSRMCAHETRWQEFIDLGSVQMSGSIRGALEMARNKGDME